MTVLELLKRQTLEDGQGIMLRAKLDGAEILAVDKRRPATADTKSLRKLCVSVCSGCAIGCIYCFTNGRHHYRPLTATEIIEQVEALIKFAPETALTDFAETKITFKEMGDPLLNPQAVLATIDHLTTVKSDFHFIVSTAAPQLNLWFYEALAQRLKTNRIRLCFSCHTTSTEERLRLNPKMKMLDLKQISEQVRKWPGLPVTLNFIVIDGFTYDLDRLAELFDPNRVFIKLNYFDDNEFVRKAGLKNATPECVAKLEQELTARGYQWSQRLRP